MEKFENAIIYIRMDEKIDRDSDEWNAIVKKELDKIGQHGWEPYQVNSLGYGEKIRVYLKRRIK